MRKTAVFVTAVLAACASCTYDVPDVQSPGKDGGAGAGDASGLADSSFDQADGQMDGPGPGDGQSGTSDAPDAGSGAKDTGVDATCSGVLCHCSNPGDCSPAAPICAQQITVGAPVFAAAGGSNFCTAPCCTSSDCPAGSVCFASGVGGQYCVNPVWLGRATPAAAALGGAACSTDAACRSGLCVSGSCADTCCSFASSATECTGGTLCTFGAFPGKNGSDTHFAPHCGVPSGTNGPGSFCSTSADCQGGLCAAGLCTSPCRAPDECNTGSACDFDSTSAEIYWACFPEAVSPNPEGAPCTGTDSQCQSDWCGPNNLCENECFTDADCSVSGWTCKPETNSTPMGNYVFLICQP